jgi:hypothetical protein
MKIKSLEDLGYWCFIAGFILAAIVGMVRAYMGSIDIITGSILIILGIIVGFINVTKKEANSFLIASVALVLVSKLGWDVLAQVDIIGPYLEAMFNSIMTFIIPATIISALKIIYHLAKDV